MVYRPNDLSMALAVTGQTHRFLSAYMLAVRMWAQFRFAAVAYPALFVLTFVVATAAAIMNPDLLTIESRDPGKARASDIIRMPPVEIHDFCEGFASSDIIKPGDPIINQKFSKATRYRICIETQVYLYKTRRSNMH